MTKPQNWESGKDRTPKGFMCLAKEFDIYSEGDKGFLTAFKQMGILNLGSSMHNGLEKGKNPSWRYLSNMVREDKDLSAQMERRMNSRASRWSNNSRRPLARVNPGEKDIMAEWELSSMSNRVTARYVSAPAPILLEGS